MISQQEPGIEQSTTLHRKAPKQTTSFREEAKETIETPLNVGHVFGFLRHGQVESNKDIVASSSKDNDEPLNKTGEGQIIQQAHLWKQLGINTQDIIIHFPSHITRDVQTARIFCEELGLPFPNDEFLQQNSPSIVQKKYPHLQLTSELATRQKGEKGEERLPALYRALSETGQESIGSATGRTLTYMADTIKAASNTPTSKSAHIFVGHRTGAKGFEQLKTRP